MLQDVNMQSAIDDRRTLTPNARRHHTTMVRSAARYLLVCVLTASLGSVAACGGADPAPTAAAPAVTASSGPAGSFGGTDLAWVEINVAMDEQLLPLLALAPQHSRNAAVRALAAQVTAFHQDELAVLRRLHDQARLPARNPHEGMPMPGMVTPDQVTEAAAVSGPAFDRLLLGHLASHLRQGVSLAGSEEKAGVEPQTRALAEQVLAHRRTFLPKVRTLAAD
jgi:uncharacterized protein (DUF305 family)